MPEQCVAILRRHTMIALPVFTGRIVLPTKIDRSKMEAGRNF